MSTPILATRLFVPPLRPEVVRRPRLIEQLNAGLHRRLTLVSAPAGFGKTTLVSEWVTSSKRPIAWVSLGQGDNDPIRFVAYVVAALQTVSEELGAGVAGLLASPQPPPIDTILTTLLNELATAPGRMILVLDDYHLVESEAVDSALGFLLEHLPPQLHLVIASREDPSLHLARLRVRDQLTELRAADLRFTPDEAVTFFNQMMGLDLSAEEVAALESRTEGWIAGLQLAALSMRGREDIGGFIQTFAGDNRYIVDYLIEEVLRRQPAAVRSFLLDTAILDQLNGPLCDAVIGQVGSNALLETLERNNLFVMPLDDRRDWFRYHHLFGDVIHAHSLEEQPERLPTLHRRASEWYERNGLSGAAIRHALAAEDFERVAHLVELEWPAMDGGFQSATWLRWAKEIPDELVHDRPVLGVAYAWAFLNVGELEAGEARLRDVEELLTAEPPAELVVADAEQFRSLPASMATARSYYAQARGDVLGTLEHARRALDLLPEEAHLKRGAIEGLLGLSYWTQGDLAAGHRSFADCMASLELGGNLMFALSATLGLGGIRVAQGRLRDAVSAWERSLRLATQHPDAPLPMVTADFYLGLAELTHEQGHVAATAGHLAKSQELGEQSALPDWACRLCLLQARLAEARGDLAGALDRLAEAERVFYRGPIPDVRPIAALRARVLLRQGRSAEAAAWVEERGLSVGDELSYFQLFEHITLARVLLANAAASPESLTLLERLLQAARDGGWTANVIEVLMVQALAHAGQGKRTLALESLERALALAEPEGYLRLFVDEGSALAQLLSEAVTRGIFPTYATKILEAFDRKVPEPLAEATASVVEPVSAQPLVEPLSKRELEVLRLVAQGLSNQQISERLFVALSTVKGHNLRIFGKLAVRRRTEAVARARELGLI